MSRATFKLVMAIGVLLFGSLCLLLLVTAAISFHRPFAAWAAIGAAGAAYLNYVCHFVTDEYRDRYGALVLPSFWLALGMGAIAWLALLFG